jgi:CBS domain containing-hemolysin-like protein
MISVNTILFFLLTLLLMAFFAGIEMAFYSANRLSLEIRKKQGGASMHILSRFIESPARFLGSTLIGFNLFLVFFSLQISNVMSPVWDYIGLHLTYVRLVAEITLATFVVLVLVEFIPGPSSGLIAIPCWCGSPMYRISFTRCSPPLLRV